MADIRLGNADNLYTQPESDKNVWNNVFGEDGNDTIRMYQGTAIGGKGNDRFEKIVDPTNLNRDLQVAYWDAGDNLKVNLAEGWAEDGLGGRDTLVGVRSIHGSGAKNAWILGDGQDNYYWPNGGDDTFIGGAGSDTISLNSGGIGTAPGLPWRNFLLSEMNIVVSADGRTATVTPKVTPTIGAGFSISVSDVEYFDAKVSTVDSDPWGRFAFGDFITHQTLAEQTIAAGSATRWNAASPLGSAINVSYSFVSSAPAGGVGATGFRAFTAAEQQLVRDILAKTAQLANISFTELTEAGATVGQLRFGVSQQSSSKGVSWMPGQSGAGDQAGDVWMDVESMAHIAVGSEGYQALLHEIGHALGLRHPRNVDSGDAWPVQMRAQDDRQTLSVMSQTASADGLWRSDWGVLDVMALRYLYGTRSVGSGDSTYVLSAVNGGSETSIVDDGGIDTIDAAAFVTGVRLDLKPGGLSNVGMTSNGFFGVENLAITATTWIENAIGTASDDVLLGNDLDNRLTPGAGNDWIEGGTGNDTVVLAGRRADYELSNSFGNLYLRARDGASGFDTLLGVERLQFTDGTVTLAATPLSSDVITTVDEDSQVTGSLPTPTDVTDRTTVSYSLVGSAGNGSAVMTTNGSYSYTPRANFWGTDHFTFRIARGTSSNEYKVYVNVLPVNDGAPTSADSETTVPPNLAHNGSVPAASDIDGDALSYALVTDPRQGTLVFNSNGSFSYQPKSGYYGNDSFSYSVSDGMGGSNAYTLTLRVGESVDEDTSLSRSMPDPAGAPRSQATYTLATPPAHGTATMSAQGVLSYTPAANYFGSDSLAYDVAVPGGTTRITLPLQVRPVNDGPPVAGNLTRSLNEDQPLSIALPSATDPDGTAVTYSLHGQVVHGGATISAAGQLNYQPAPNYHGSDSFSYRVTDSDGAFSSYTISLTITPVNDAPTGGVTLSGTPRVGQTLAAAQTLADADGLGTLSWSWLRDGIAIGGATGMTYRLVADDAGKAISVRASYTDAGGSAELITSAATASVLAVNIVTGGTGNDSLLGTPGADSVSGLAGSDTLSGLAGDDELLGGDGNDRLNGGSGNDTLDGGAGLADIADYRGATAANVNLATGGATHGSDSDTLVNIEAIFGSSAADTLRGIDGPVKPGETFRGGGGDDSIFGGTGTDTAEYLGNLADYTLTRTPGTLDITVAHKNGGADGTDALNGIEHILFADRLVCFGPRAEDVARVAFALWTPAIYNSPSLFSKGMSFYDNEFGYSFDTLCQVALQYWTETGTALAAKLKASIPGIAYSQAQLLQIMTDNGGGSSLSGRAAAVKAVALDAATTQQLELMGVTTKGVVASHNFDAEVYFAFLPG